jgi:hypothetical protein
LVGISGVQKQAKAKDDYRVITGIQHSGPKARTITAQPAGLGLERAGIEGLKARHIVAARNVPGFQPLDSQPLGTQPCGLGCYVADLRSSKTRHACWLSKPDHHHDAKYRGSFARLRMTIFLRL